MNMRTERDAISGSFPMVLWRARFQFFALVTSFPYHRLQVRARPRQEEDDMDEGCNCCNCVRCRAERAEGAAKERKEIVEMLSEHLGKEGSCSQLAIDLIRARGEKIMFCDSCGTPLRVEEMPKKLEKLAVLDGYKYITNGIVLTAEGLDKLNAVIDTVNEMRK